MSGWNDFLYYFIICSTILLSAQGLWLCAIMPGVDRWNRRFFICFFIVLIVSALSGLVDAIHRLPVPISTIKVVQIAECLLLALPLPLLTVLLLHCCGEDLQKSRLLRTVCALWAVYFVLVASSLFTDAFILITPDRLAQRGPWYPLMLLPTVAIMLRNLTGTIRRRGLLSRKVYLSFLMALLPMTLTVIVQLFVDIFLLIGICTALFAPSMYGIILSDEIERDMRRQREIADQKLEIANQRASIMVLEMRPHFIYNTMTSIYCLCKRDPERAAQVVMDFTTYLRKNFGAVASAEPIPFTAELEHTRAYLAVEQAQHSKSLHVDYDTPHTFFRVTPLTLQPIVENAIKHGRDPYKGPLHVQITTRRTDGGSEIVVSDDGRGLDGAGGGEPHVALRNIRQRLELMCGGTLTIRPNDGGGTRVTVTIPSAATREA